MDFIITNQTNFIAMDIEDYKLIELQNNAHASNSKHKEMQHIIDIEPERITAMSANILKDTNINQILKTGGVIITHSGIFHAQRLLAQLLQDLANNPEVIFNFYPIFLYSDYCKDYQSSLKRSKEISDEIDSLKTLETYKKMPQLIAHATEDKEGDFASTNFTKFVDLIIEKHKKQKFTEKLNKEIKDANLSK